MAVKHKTGLDYFPFDIDFFSDEKIEFVSARFGLKGELIAVKLLCKIYRNNGYYTEWTEDDATMFAKRVGDGVTPALVNDVVNELAKRDFFDQDIFSSFKVLTSRGIQRRYFDAVERRKSQEVFRHLLLIDVENYKNVTTVDQNVNIEGENDNISKQSKLKKRRVNESKEKDEGAGASTSEKKSFKNFTEEDFIDELKSFQTQFPKEVLNPFYKYWKEKSPSGKMRFQLEKTWETKLRLEKWQNNQEKFQSKNNGTNKQNIKPVPTIVSAGGFGQL